MIKPIRVLGLLSLLGSFLTIGCSIFPEAQPNIPVSYFDIGTPGKIEEMGLAKKIYIQDVKTTDPYNERMVFRASDTHIRIDDYNRWASSPNEMFRRYFILAFSQNEINKLQAQDDNKLELYLTIICFEANLVTNEVKLSLFAELKNPQDGSVVYTELMTDSVKADKMSAESFASAVKVLTDRMIDSFAKNISQIKASK